MTDHAQRAREMTPTELKARRIANELIGQTGAEKERIIAADLEQAAQEAASRITDLEREIQSLRSCQCEGCDESLEGSAYCEKCFRKLQAAQPVWSGDKPTKAGWYWWRMTLPVAQRFMLCLSPHPHADRVGLWVSGIHLQGLSNLDDWGGEWAGPLMEPREA